MLKVFVLGKVGEMGREPKNKIEMIYPEDKLADVIKAIKQVHPYEIQEIDVVKLEYWQKT